MIPGENPVLYEKRVSLTVNGEKIDREIDSRMTLAEFLREVLDLTGTKVGCNRGECGSCTVLLDGMAIYSCTTLAVEASGREVRTIESLGTAGELHPLQRAFIEHDAFQCGYCTPGILLSLTALLEDNPTATAEEIRSAIDGNLCRCGSYPNVIEAALEAGRHMAKGRE